MSFVQTLNDIEFIKARITKARFVRISAPLFLEKDSGLNDDLNGTEEKVTFDFNGKTLEIVQSLAKWKRVVIEEVDSLSETTRNDGGFGSTENDTKLILFLL